MGSQGDGEAAVESQADGEGVVHVVRKPRTFLEMAQVPEEGSIKKKPPQNNRQLKDLILTHPGNYQRACASENRSLARKNREQQVKQIGQRQVAAQTKIKRYGIKINPRL